MLVNCDCGVEINERFTYFARVLKQIEFTLSDKLVFAYELTYGFVLGNPVIRLIDSMLGEF